MGRLMPLPGEEPLDGWQLEVARWFGIPPHLLMPARPDGYRGRHRNPGPMHRGLDALLDGVAALGRALHMDPGPAGETGTPPADPADTTYGSTQ